MSINLRANEEMTEPTIQCSCAGSFLKQSIEYHASPGGETKFDLGSEKYHRRYDRCELCHHWFSVNKMNMEGLYKGNYVASTYGTKMRDIFQKIVMLPVDQSDNAGRIKYVKDFASSYFERDAPVSLLDVGAGLGVFPHVVKQQGWSCTAIDPDPHAVEHMRDVVGVHAVQGDFMDVQNLGRFNIVTFNKVLEHVPDPVLMLAKAKEFLAPKGLVYVELPDGDAAALDGSDREEFFIEHLHVFSFTSVSLMGERAGLTALQVERVREPSGKYTIRSFFVLI
jgi:SAM-dependent methyltransferase